MPDLPSSKRPKRETHLRRNNDPALRGYPVRRTTVYTLLSGTSGSREVLDMMMREPACQVKGSSFQPGEMFEEVARLEAEVVVIDLSVEVADASAYLTSVRDQFPNIGILALSEDVRPGAIEHAIRAGANGFLAYSEVEKQLAKALELVRRGEIYVGEENRGRLLEFLLILSEMNGSGLEERLSRREFQVFRAIGKGRSLREISEAFDLKHKTVETYRDRIKEKLRLRDSRQLTLFAVRWVLRHGRADT